VSENGADSTTKARHAVIVVFCPKLGSARQSAWMHDFGHLTNLDSYDFGGSHPPVSPRITAIVCQMRHTSRDQRCKVAHRVSESDDLKLRGGCDVGIWIDRYHSADLFGSLAHTRFVRAKSHWMFASAAPRVTVETVRLPSRTWIGVRSYDFN
jgi:hypothetical protein